MEDEGLSDMPSFHLGDKITALGKYSVSTDRDQYYDDEVIKCTAKVHLNEGEARVRNLNLVLYARIVYYYPGTGRVKTARKISMLKEPVQESLVEQGVDHEFTASFAVPLFTPPAFNTRHTVALSSIYVVVITRIIWTVELVGEVIHSNSLETIDPGVAAQDHVLMVLAYKEIDKRTVYRSECMHATVEGMTTLSKRSSQMSRASFLSRRQRIHESGMRRPSLSTSDIREAALLDQESSHVRPTATPPPQPRDNTSSGYEQSIVDVRVNRRGRGYTVGELCPPPPSITGSPGAARVQRLRAATNVDGNRALATPGGQNLHDLRPIASNFGDNAQTGPVDEPGGQVARDVVSAPNSTSGFECLSSNDLSGVHAATESTADSLPANSSRDAISSESAPDSHQVRSPSPQVDTILESPRSDQQQIYDPQAQPSNSTELHPHKPSKPMEMTKQQLHFMYKAQDELAQNKSVATSNGGGDDGDSNTLNQILETDFDKHSEVNEDNYIIMRCSIREPGTLSNNKPFGIEVSVLTSSRVLVARSISAKLIQSTTYNLNNNYTPSVGSCVVNRAVKNLKFKTIGRKLKPVQTHTLVLDPACPKKPVFTNNFSCEGIRGDVPAPTAEVVDIMETLLVAVEYTVQVKCRVWGGPDIVCDIPIVLESCGVDCVSNPSSARNSSADGGNTGSRATIISSSFNSAETSSPLNPLSVSIPNNNVTSGPVSATRRLRDLTINTGEVTRDPLRVNSPRQVDSSSPLPEYEEINEESTKSFGPLSRRASDLKSNHTAAQRTRSFSSGGRKMSSLTGLQGLLKRKTANITSRLSVGSNTGTDVERKPFHHEGLEPIPAVPTALSLEAEDSPQTPRAPRRDSFFLDGVELPNYVEVFNSQP